MTRGECLQQVLQAAARVAHAVSRLDSMPMQALGEAGERAVDKIVASRDASGTGRPQFAARISQSKSEVEARLDDVPSVDEQHRDAPMTRDDRADALRDQFEQPRRALDDLREAVAVEPIAIHRDIDQRRRAEPRRESARDLRGVKVVDLGIQHRARARLGASAVRRNQEQGRIGIDYLEP